MIRRLTDKGAIERFARSDPGKFLFELADLDDIAWSSTDYYGKESGGSLAEICLLYRGLRPPNLVATVATSDREMGQLISGIVEHLPDHFTAAASPCVTEALQGRFQVENRSPFLRMATTDTGRLESTDVSGVEPLDEADRPEAVELLKTSFQAARFESLVWGSRRFFGYREAGDLVSVAGTTFFSERYGVAAVGPVATRHDARGRGLARRTTARLCQELASAGARIIGLHVRTENVPAIRCYERLGFAKTAEFENCLMTRIGS